MPYSNHSLTPLEIIERIGGNSADFLAVAGDEGMANLLAASCIELFKTGSLDTIVALLEVHICHNPGSPIELDMGVPENTCLSPDSTRDCDRCIDRYECDVYAAKQHQPHARTLN